MNLHVRRAQRLLRRHGLFTATGAALLLLAAAFHALAVQPLQPQVRELRAQAGLVQQQLRSGQLAPRERPATVSEQLRTFQTFFPRADSVPHWLDTIHTIGRASGLAIRSGEYRLERAEQGLWRYHVTLPVSGSYVQVRQFITFVLREVPAASLDDVQLRKEAGAGERLEARLRFSIHLAGG